MSGSSAQTERVDALLDLLNLTLEQGSADPILDRLAPGAVVWHNDDKQERDAADNMRRATQLHRVLRDVRVEVLQREQVSDGLLQRFVIRGTAVATGQPVAAHNCVFVHVDPDSMISRIDEYVDPTFGAQLGLGG